MKPIKLRCERSICLKKDLKFVLLISKKTFPFYLFENQVRTRRIIRLTSKEILSPNLIFSVSGFAVTFNYTYKLFNFHHSLCRTAIKWKPRRLAGRSVRFNVCLFSSKPLLGIYKEVSTSYLTGVLVFGSTFGESLFMMTLYDDFYKDRTFQKSKRSTRLTYYVKSTPRWPWGEGKGWKVGTVMEALIWIL